MCGIGGIVRIGKRPIRKWQLQQMAIELEHRGRDATGFATMDQDGQIWAFKIAAPAWKAIELPAFHDWADKTLSDKTQILLVHTRAWTKGSPQINDNNHPLFVDRGASTPIQGVVVHNGMVRNDDSLFEANANKQGFERNCLTDSDIFRALLDNWGCVDKGLIKEMCLVEGTAAVAAMHSASPGKLLLLRDGNPLMLGATSETLAFASNKEALHKVLKPWIKLHNIPMQVHAPDLSFIPVRPQTGYIIGPHGIESHDIFKCNGRSYSGYTKYATKSPTWGDKQERARLAALSEKKFDKPAFVVNPTKNGKGVTVLVNEREVTSDRKVFNSPGFYDYVLCTNHKCGQHVRLSDDDRKLDSLTALACKNCGTNLGGAPDASMRIN